MAYPDSKELTWYYEDMSTRASSEASIPANEILSVSANFKENREARGSSSDSKSYGIEIIAIRVAYRCGVQQN